MLDNKNYINNVILVVFLLNLVNNFDASSIFNMDNFDGSSILSNIFTKSSNKKTEEKNVDDNKDTKDTKDTKDIKVNTKTQSTDMSFSKPSKERIINERKKFYTVDMNNRAFPLDDENNFDIKKDKNIKEKTNNKNIFNKSNTNNVDVLEAVTTINPYLFPKNQIILRTIVKLTSILEDVSTLIKKNYTTDVAVNSLSLPEALNVVRDMSPYLNPETQRQVNNIYSGVNNIKGIRNQILNFQENREINVESVLNQLKPFIPTTRYNQVKQLTGVVKALQTGSQLAEIKNLTASDNTDTSINENEQLQDIMNLLDTFQKDKKDN